MVGLVTANAANMDRQEQEQGSRARRWKRTLTHGTPMGCGGSQAPARQKSLPGQSPSLMHCTHRLRRHTNPGQWQPWIDLDQD